ncbi:hypothetical protein [Methylobacterium mesophilicum]|uniref:hypothetical protein n=1 Tax=Methylobacterium mesophilicum TaxID=39956 RepID=UPI001FCE342D|nr:hypothetical protein [Methylobacterium mesophilicum]
MEKDDHGDVIAAIGPGVMGRSLDTDRIAEGVQDRAVHRQRNPAGRGKAKVRGELDRIHTRQRRAAPEVKGPTRLDVICGLDENRYSFTHAHRAMPSRSSALAAAFSVDETGTSVADALARRKRDHSARRATGPAAGSTPGRIAGPDLA